MRQARWFLHPVFIFALSTAALAISLFLYIYWYIGVSENLKLVIQRYQLDVNQFFEAKTWVVILILSLLVGVIMLGTLIIFIYNQKTLQLYRLQRTFINNFTHELKTPVTSLKIYLETFLRHRLPREEQLRCIGFMLQDTERLSGNINSILNLARIESGLETGRPTPVDLHDAVGRFVTENRHLFRDCEIRLPPPPDVKPVCLLIAPLFEMLLMNVMTNAIKYNASATPKIDVSFERNRQWIRLRFRDNGIGIAREELKKIFGKFYRGRPDERVPAGGSGIGLYLVQQIARLHKGRVTAESDGDGTGSTFTLFLPAAAGGRGAARPAEER